MEPEKRNAAYLWDMLESARDIVQFTAGIGIDEYIKDRKLQLAIERLLEIIGEAAKNISMDFQEKHNEIPWKKIIGQRNVIDHEYGEMQYSRLAPFFSTNLRTLRTSHPPSFLNHAKATGFCLKVI